MAGADYWHCLKCDRKLVYDPDEKYSEGHLYCEDCYKKLQARVEKLEKALNKIAVGDDESDPYGYIPRDEFRDIAKQALKGGE